MLASLLLVGCDTDHMKLNTAPLKSDTETAEIAPADSLEFQISGDEAIATELGGPLAGLTAEELKRFAEGKDEFEEEETVEEGLGPVFNEASCKTCHDAPVGGTSGRGETRFGRWDQGRFNPLAHRGGSLIQDKAIGHVVTPNGEYTFVPEVVPREANVSATRITTPLFGLGLVDAVSDAVLLELARRQARNTPSTRGTAHVVTEAGTGETRVGRFGWKAQVSTLREFSADAYLNEMGITSPLFPNENAPQGNLAALAYNPLPTMNDAGEGVVAFFDFMTLLGPPPRGRRTDQTDAGGKIFREIGCANCHTPTLMTGESPVAALNRKSFQPFSDFLLHDMGSLGDGIVQGRAGARQIRTAPLWGLRSRPVFLHDGRASTPQAAILAHDGQGSAARERFTRLGFRDRLALFAYLRIL